MLERGRDGGSFFVTGTGTDVGKTVVTAGLARRFCAEGVDCVAVKPIQTGAREKHGRWVLPDCEVYRAAGLVMPESGEDEYAYAFEPACSPHLAAAMTAVTISLERVTRFIEPFFERHECVLVEGAGGVAVPLNENETMLDLMKLLGLPVLLVAANRLGILNHTLLSLQAIRGAGLEVAGVILSNVTPVTDANRFIREDNRSTIEHFGRVPVVAEIEHIPGFNSSTVEHWQRIDTCLKHIH